MLPRLETYQNVTGRKNTMLWACLVLVVVAITRIATEQNMVKDAFSDQNAMQHSSSMGLNNCLLNVANAKGVKIYSQNDEDGALLQILRCMGGHGTKEYFEFGAETGTEVNTRILREQYGWNGHLMDGSNEDPSIPLHQEFITPSNIVSLLEKYKASKTLDVLSVDVDYDDFFVLREILLAGYRPRVLISEYNINFGADWAVTTLAKPVGRESEFYWQGDCYFGASAQAFINLVKPFGYTPVFVNICNIMFVQTDQARSLGLMIPAVENFPRARPEVIHSNCEGRTWKLIDSDVAERVASDERLSHVEFAKSFRDVVLDHTDVHSTTSEGEQVWRFFKEIS